MITRSKGSQREDESRELGEVRWRGGGGGVEGGGGGRGVEKKGEEIGSQKLCESAVPNPEDHVNALHFN